MNLTFSSPPPPPPPPPDFEQTNDRHVEKHYFIPDNSEADMILEMEVPRLHLLSGQTLIFLSATCLF
eukprot:15361780-Ditylum_brightwellii.AAC.1